MSYNQLSSQRQQEPSDSHNPNKVVQKNCVKEKKRQQHIKVANLKFGRGLRFLFLSNQCDWKWNSSVLSLWWSKRKAWPSLCYPGSSDIKRLARRQTIKATQWCIIFQTSNSVWSQPSERHARKQAAIWRQPERDTHVEKKNTNTSRIP